MLLPDPLIFRAYDIRGKVSETLTAEVVELIGKAFGTFIKNRGGSKVSLARDNRETSTYLSKDFARGVLSTGVDILDIGLAPTPMLYFSIIKFNLDGGATVTASHNTPDYNGIKLCQREALHIFGEELKEVRKMVEGQSFSFGQGRLTKDDIFFEYEAGIISRIRLQRPVKISISSQDEIFTRLGCQIVKKEEAEVGLAFDPDGDRLIVFDENGRQLLTEAIATLLAKEILTRRKNSKVKFVYDVKSLLGFKKVVKRYGGQAGMLPTGRSYFRQKIFEEPSIALGVEASGHIYINDNYYGFDDALFAAARLLEIVSKTREPLSNLLSDFPSSFYTPPLEPFCPDEKKFAVVDGLRSRLSKKYDTIEIDGVRVKLDEESWFLIRASNTGPRLTLRFEADTEEKVWKMIEIAAAELSRYPEVEGGWVEEAKANVHHD